MGQPPIIVRLVEPEGDPTGLSAVLIGALGLTGVLVLCALLAAVLFGALLVWLRSRQSPDRGDSV
jgi:hypothetical protein